jgi:hypothetical protein
MLKGKHIMIAIMILLLSLVNLAIYLYWDIPSEEDWRLGSNYTFLMILILIIEYAIIAAGILYNISVNWKRWWNSEIKININKH